MSNDHADLSDEVQAYRRRRESPTPQAKDPALIRAEATESMNTSLSWAVKTLQAAGYPKLELWTENWLGRKVVKASGWDFGIFILTTSGAAHEPMRGYNSSARPTAPGLARLNEPITLGPFRNDGLFYITPIYIGDDGVVYANYRGTLDDNFTLQAFLEVMISRKLAE